MGDIKNSATNVKKTSAKKVRLRGGETSAVGTTRYTLLRSVAIRIREAMSAGFYLEATTLLESLITERLEKRVQWLHQNLGEPQGSTDALTKLKDGFQTVCRLVNTLKVYEPDPELHAVLDPIAVWSSGRNEAIHEMAKLGHGAEKTWDERYLSAHGVAVEGIKLVILLDQHERRVSHASRKKRNASATCPDALLPLGQTPCEWCGRSSRASG